MATKRVGPFDPLEVVQRVADAMPLAIYGCSRAGELLFANAVARALDRPADELQRELAEAAQPCGHDERWLRRELDLGSAKVVLLIWLGAPRSLARAVHVAAATYELTVGQLRVLLHLAEDPHPGRVARALNRSPHTMKRHLEQIYAKTDSGSLAHLIRKLVDYLR